MRSGHCRNCREVKRLDLSEVVLTLKAAGIDDIINVPWLEKPDPKALERAEMLLEDLGAIHGGGVPSPRHDDAARGGGTPPPKNSTTTDVGRRMLRVS